MHGQKRPNKPKCQLSRGHQREVHHLHEEHCDAMASALAASLPVPFGHDDPRYLGWGTFAVILLTYACGALPFTLLDVVGACGRYRCQPLRRPGTAEYVVCAKLVATNFLLLAAASAFSGAPLQRMLAPIDATAPPLWSCAIQIALFFVVDDVIFHQYHRALHENRRLYRRFHKQHHVFVTPFALTSHATHPVEMMLQSVGAMAGPLLNPIAGPLNTHVGVFWLWLIVRQLQGIEDHCGYDFPLLSPSSWSFGVLGGAEFHDAHHERQVGNYASCFPVIDRVFGTLLPAKHGVGGASGGGEASVADSKDA